MVAKLQWQQSSDGNKSSNGNKNSNANKSSKGTKSSNGNERTNGIKVPMATKFQWQQSSDGNKSSNSNKRLTTKVPNVTKIPMATNKYLAVFAHTYKRKGMIKNNLHDFSVI